MKKRIYKNKRKKKSNKNTHRREHENRANASRKCECATCNDDVTTTTSTTKPETETKRCRRTHSDVEGGMGRKGSAPMGLRHVPGPPHRAVKRKSMTYDINSNESKRT